MNQICEKAKKEKAADRRRYIYLGQGERAQCLAQKKTTVDNSKRDTTECRQVGWWGQGESRCAEVLPVSSSGRICVGRSPKFAKSQAPEREAQATETETDAVAAFVARKRKTVRQFIPIDSFANTRLQEQQQLSQGTSNIQHSTSKASNVTPKNW